MARMTARILDGKVKGDDNRQGRRVRQGTAAALRARSVQTCLATLARLAVRGLAALAVVTPATCLWRAIGQDGFPLVCPALGFA